MCVCVCVVCVCVCVFVCVRVCVKVTAVNVVFLSTHKSSFFLKQRELGGAEVGGKNLSYTNVPLSVYRWWRRTLVLLTNSSPDINSGVCSCVRVFVCMCVLFDQ